MNSNPYQVPELYELAFSWRDYVKAVDFLIEAARRSGRSSVGSMVELGCGPGQYCREFARRGGTAYGVDLAPEMALYAQKCFDEGNLPGYILEADMRDFRLEQPVDLACCMMNTFGLLQTNQDALANLNAVASNLTPDGIYIIEISHPRDVFRKPETVDNTWKMENGSGKLQIDWASDPDFDPITELAKGTVTMTWEKDGQTTVHQAPESFRSYTFGLMRALVELSGRFKIGNVYGDLDVEVPFDNAKKAWREVLVLRKFD
ncbi:MAG: class I SAM-dependent methyltransferase [bacterium]